MYEEAFDLSLTARAAAGDREGFARLVRKYQDGVYRLLLRLVSDDEDARDLAAETFVRAWRRIATFRGQASFKTWLWRIAINVSRSHLRKRYVRRALFLQDTRTTEDGDSPREREAPDPSVEADPVRCLENEALKAAIRSARSSLSGREQEVFTLKHDQGLKIAEIARILSLSENTVKVLLFRATRKMADALRSDGQGSLRAVPEYGGTDDL